MFSRVCWKFPLKICPHDIALFLFFESRQVELSTLRKTQLEFKCRTSSAHRRFLIEFHTHHSMLRIKTSFSLNEVYSLHEVHLQTY